MNNDELALLRRVARGDQAALARLYARYGAVVYSLVYTVVRDAALAQEVTQDAFLKVWNNPTAWDSTKGAFSSWLLTLARYTAIDRLRAEIRRTGRNTDLYDEIAAADDEPHPDSDRVRQLIARLPVEQRQLIELAFFGGLTHTELAARLDLPLGTVKTRLRLGLHKLRHWLTEQSR